MARGHQKELARARNDKNGPSGKPTTQKGTAGKEIQRRLELVYSTRSALLAAGLTIQCVVCKVN